MTTRHPGKAPVTHSGAGETRTEGQAVSVTTLGPPDSAVLARLHALSFATPWSETALCDLLSQSGVSGLGLDGAGFLVFRIVADEAEILTLATEPGQRRRGLGRRLVEAAALKARQSGADRIFLEVAEDNEAALALYARCGFLQVGHRRGYYRRATGTEVDARVLALELNGHLPTT